MIGAVNEAGQHVSLWSDYWSVLTDPAHLGVELTVEAITGGLAFLWGALWVKRHDRSHHHGHTTDVADWLTPERQAAIEELLRNA